MDSISSQSLKNMLLDIYPCKKTFDLLLIDKKPKTKCGVYIVDKMRIRIYTWWKDHVPIKEIAIHEYAHHIHDTEKRRTNDKRKERAHGAFAGNRFFEMSGTGRT